MKLSYNKPLIVITIFVIFIIGSIYIFIITPYFQLKTNLYDINIQKSKILSLNKELGFVQQKNSNLKDKNLQLENELLNKDIDSSFSSFEELQIYFFILAKKHNTTIEQLGRVEKIESNIYRLPFIIKASTSNFFNLINEIENDKISVNFVNDGSYLELSNNFIKFSSKLHSVIGNTKTDYLKILDIKNISKLTFNKNTYYYIYFNDNSSLLFNEKEVKKFNIQL